MVGIALRALPDLRPVAAPVVLLPALLLIATHAALDALDDIFRVPGTGYAIQRTSELIEMLIGCTALAYVWLKRRNLTG